MAGRLSPSPDWRWILAARMGKALRPQDGKGKLSGWEALAIVQREMEAHGLDRVSLAERGTRKGTF